MARHDQLRARVAEASSEVSRLEAQVPDAAASEAPGLTLRLLTGAALLAEGWLCYASLSQILDDQPIPLLLSSIVAAPLAGVLLHRAGTLARRTSWEDRIGWTELALLVLCVMAPVVLGAGVVLSRVGEASGVERTVGLVVGAGLQASLLLVPAVLGWQAQSANPVPGLAEARRQLAQATDQQVLVVRKLEAITQREVEITRARAARLEECLAALAYWTAVYHHVPPADRAGTSVTNEPHPWSAPTRYLALPSGGSRA